MNEETFPNRMICGLHPTSWCCRFFAYDQCFGLQFYVFLLEMAYKIASWWWNFDMFDTIESEKCHQATTDFCWFIETFYINKIALQFQKRFWVTSTKSLETSGGKTRIIGKDYDS